MSDLRASPELAATMRRQGFWRDETVDACLDRWATRRPGGLALVDGAGRFTWEAVARLVERVAHGLRAHGVEPGSAISCQLPNWNEFVVVALAALRLGAVLNPIPPIYRAGELRFILGLLESRVLVVPGVFRGFDHAAMAAGLRTELPVLEHVFVARGEPGEGGQPFAALTETAWERREGRRPLAGTDPNRVCEVIFTSGTTGEPKGVGHTSNTALALLYPAIERLAFTEREVILMSSTFGHQTGYLYGCCMTLLLGATGVWLEGPHHPRRREPVAGRDRESPVRASQGCRRRRRRDARCTSGRARMRVRRAEARRAPDARRADGLGGGAGQRLPDLDRGRRHVGRKRDARGAVEVLEGTVPARCEVDIRHLAPAPVTSQEVHQVEHPGVRGERASPPTSRRSGVKARPCGGRSPDYRFRMS